MGIRSTSPEFVIPKVGSLNHSTTPSLFISSPSYACPSPPSSHTLQPRVTPVAHYTPSTSSLSHAWLSHSIPVPHLPRKTPPFPTPALCHSPPHAARSTSCSTPRNLINHCLAALLHSTTPPQPHSRSCIIIPPTHKASHQPYQIHLSRFHLTCHIHV